MQSWKIKRQIGCAVLFEVVVCALPESNVSLGQASLGVIELFGRGSVDTLGVTSHDVPIVLLFDRSTPVAAQCTTMIVIRK